MVKRIVGLIRREDIQKQLANSWSVCWPMAFIMFFEFLISLADVFIAGRIGKEVQAAYGFVVQCYFILIVISIALSVGSVSVVSRLHTARKRKEQSEAVFSTMVASFVSGIILGVSGMIFAPHIIGMLSIPQEVKVYAIPLLRLYSLGIIFHYCLVTSNAVLRATNMVKKSLKTMGRICVLNIVLNFILVFHTPLGFRGIAVSTAASVTIGAILNLAYIRKVLLAHRHFSWQKIGLIFNIGWPIGLLQVIWQLGSATVFIILARIPYHTVEVLAAYTNGMRLESAIFLPAFAFNMANAVVIGNLLGEEKKEEAFRNGLITAVLGVAIVTVLTIIVVVLAPFIVPLLTKSAIVNRETLTYIYITMLAEPFMAWSVILGGALNGAGDTRSVLVRVGAMVWLIRIPLATVFVLVFHMNAYAVWWAMNCSLYVHSILMTKRYFSRKWLDV